MRIIVQREDGEVVRVLFNGRTYFRPNHDFEIDTVPYFANSYEEVENPIAFIKGHNLIMRFRKWDQVKISAAVTKTVPLIGSVSRATHRIGLTQVMFKRSPDHKYEFAEVRNGDIILVQDDPK